MDAPTLTRSRLFLLAAAAIFTAGFAAPLFIDPYWWARTFGWDTGPETELGVYFGRCLGAVAIALSAAALVASRAPARNRSLFTLIAGLTGLLAVVHLRGLIEDSQPLVEHLETGSYLLVGAVALWCRPPAPG
jgi:hypothetical protein